MLRIFPFPDLCHIALLNTDKIILACKALQQALLTTSTEKRYKELAKLHNEPELIEKLPVEGSVGWFGSKFSQRVLAYIHGGGLVVYATLAQVQMAYDVYKAAKISSGEIALAILFYGEQCRWRYSMVLTF